MHFFDKYTVITARTHMYDLVCFERLIFTNIDACVLFAMSNKENNRSKISWWAISYLLPIFSILTGVLVAILIPKRENDWLGIGFIIPIYIGILAGCGLACIGSIISLKKREKLSWLSLLIAIPAAIFLIYSAVQIVIITREQIEYNSLNH